MVDIVLAERAQVGHVRRQGGHLSHEALELFGVLRCDGAAEELMRQSGNVRLVD